jgi:MinD-like ATPase involved in chromosome partitioning or flagellar assembly
MPKTIVVHSYRGGTGKSNVSANLAALLAAQGQRVAVVDTDIQSPGIHVLFGLEPDQIERPLNHYLWGECSLEETAHDVTAHLGAAVPGQVLLLPSSIRPDDIARILREGFDADLLVDGLETLVDALGLDVLILDTHPGLNQETLLLTTMADTLVVVLRPDQQDFQGTSVVVEVARKLDVPRMLLVVNKAPPARDLEPLRAQVEQAYACEVAALLPHSDALLTLGSRGIFVLQYPDDVVSGALQTLAARLLA